MIHSVTVIGQPDTLQPHFPATSRDDFNPTADDSCASRPDDKGPAICRVRDVNLTGMKPKASCALTAPNSREADHS